MDVGVARRLRSKNKHMVVLKLSTDSRSCFQFSYFGIDCTDSVSTEQPDRRPRVTHAKKLSECNRPRVLNTQKT